MKPPLSLYVHLPWCVQKCPYCDFNSHAGGDRGQRRRYLEALLLDIGREAERAGDRPIETVFLGGGTPSLFTPEEIARLLRGVREHFTLAADAEITMEANPGTVECGEPAAYRQAGVNRLSIGGQSFSNALLKSLGRIHSSSDIERAVHDARGAGFDDINIDLMHGLPGQSVAAALADLRAAIALEPTHVSWYQLTLEPNTVFFARPPPGLPDEETAWDMQQQGQALLADSGFVQYEVSAYAREQRRCRHNLNYWLFGDYLAAGAGAHGKLSHAGGVIRYIKPANPLQYVQTIEAGRAGAEPRALPKNERFFEFMLNALRLTDGFGEDLFADRTGGSAAELRALMQPPLTKGLVERGPNGVWRPTALGRNFLDDLQAGFLPDGPAAAAADSAG